MRFIDLHSDTMGECIARSRGEVNLITNPGHINLNKLQQGDAWAQFFAIYIVSHEGMDSIGLNMTPYEYFNFVYRSYIGEMERCKQYIAPAFSYDDLIKNKKDGKLSSVLTIEDGAPIDGKMERIDEFYKLGVRLITLTWNYENSLGFPHSRVPQDMAKGLKPFGIEAVAHMNDLGILVDVSHLSDGGFWDVAKHSKKPFVASHSCCRALADRTRCMTDEMLRALGENGGICGINFAATFLRVNSEMTTYQDIIDHALHIKKVAGIDAVALGSDFDGIGSELEFKDYSGMPKIAEHLNTCFTADEVEKIANGNALRVIRESMK